MKSRLMFELKFRLVGITLKLISDASLYWEDDNSRIQEPVTGEIQVDGSSKRAGLLVRCISQILQNPCCTRVDPTQFGCGHGISTGFGQLNSHGLITPMAKKYRWIVFGLCHIHIHIKYYSTLLLYEITYVQKYCSTKCPECISYPPKLVHFWSTWHRCGTFFECLSNLLSSHIKMCSVCCLREASKAL